MSGLYDTALNDRETLELAQRLVRIDSVNPSLVPGVEGMSEPFSGAIEDGRLLGRGAQDVKGGLAAMLAAAVVLYGLVSGGTFAWSRWAKALGGKT